jgi:heme A synthase
MALPLSIAVAHNLVAALLLLTLITINHRSWFRVTDTEKR